MNVPFIDLALQHKEIRKQIDKSIRSVIDRNDFILGKESALFEKEFAEYCGCVYAVGVSSGTAALFLALKGLGVGKGDEVIVPVFTFIATAFGVSYTGAKPVFVDVDEKTYNIDPVRIKEAVTRKTKAIIPVHLFGQPADMPEIVNICRERNLKIIEDAAQAHGAAIKMPDNKWHKAGSIGDIGCFSFYPTKNMGGMGDAGMVVTDDKYVYQKILLLRNYGSVSRYEHISVGYNTRLDGIQAAVLRLKLRKLDRWNGLRIKTAESYNRQLKDAQGIIIPYKDERVRHIYHAYCIRAEKRDELLRRFRNNRIGTIIYYPSPLHLQKAFADLGYKKGDFPAAEKIAQEIISLPIYPHINEKQIAWVVKTIKKG